jgi:hypothetical protein
MFDVDPFDMDMDGIVDGVDFLGFDYLIRYVLGREDSEEDEATEDNGMWQAEIPRDL